MKKNLFLLLLSVVSFNCFAQIAFEKGYYIDNSDKKIECFIKNKDWKNNPTAFYYKLTENEKAQKASIKLVKEFAFGGVKFLRGDVEIDRSSEKAENLTKVKAPDFRKEQLFLKELVGGTAKLYVYEDDKVRRYFFSTPTSDIKQLIFKSYIDSEGSIAYNNAFKGQLWDRFKSQDIVMKDVKTLSYRKKSLVKFFSKLNGTDTERVLKTTSRNLKEKLNLSIRPGLSSASFSMENGKSRIGKVDFDRELTARLGLELEYILPFHKNKWAFILEPTFVFLKSEKEGTYKITSSLSKNFTSSIDYKSIEIPLGIRHYFFLNNKSKLFLDGLFITDFPIGSSIVAERTDLTSLLDLEIVTNSNFSVGLGYQWNNKHSVELRYGMAKNLMSDRPSWDSNYNTVSFIYGFRFF